MKTELTLIERADLFANAAHAAVGQVRKYSKEPYIVHPRSVVDIMRQFAVGSISDEQCAAGLLHDVCEDTGVTLDLITEIFGEKVATLVDDLTDVSKPEDGNRRVRKAKDLEHTANASPEAQTVKLSDLIDNAKSIVEHDPGFARTWLREKAAMLEVLKEGDEGLLREAYRVLNESLNQLNNPKV
jgi:(p)ppGpp synthase/HD superfamily hydrolase